MKKLSLAFLLLFSTNVMSNTISFRMAPVSFLIGMVNGEIGYGFGNFSVGIGGASLDATILDLDVKATETHARVDYWFNGAFNQGWYLNAFYSKIDIEITEENFQNSGISGKGTLNTTGIGGGAGFRWAWTSFFMELGGQFISYAESEIELEDSLGNKETESAPTTGTGLEFNLGWAF